MLSAFGRAFKTPDLRRKLLFTLGIITLYRFGTHVPTPGVSYTLVQQCIEGADTSSGFLGLANLFSGGAMLNISIFALGIMPYITASIITQLLTVVIPRFEALKKEGQAGQAKMTQYTRYLTIALAVLQSSTLITFARNPEQLFGPGCTNVLADDSMVTILIMVLTMTAGTGLIMWLGELITDKGVGNGMSILIFASIAAYFPSQLNQIREADGWDIFLAVMAIGFLIIALVVFVEQSQRRIPVQYAKRMVGRQMYGGTSTYIPLKVNMAGVIPVIFSSSLMMLPVMIAQFNTPPLGVDPPRWVTIINEYFGGQGSHPVYMVTFIALTVFFVFFYVSITFNPTEVADNMKRYGGFIPGIRAGRPTAEYLSYVLNRITVVGAIYLALVALIPLIALRLIEADQNFPFGGTSILIIVGVGLETLKQIESQLQQRHYEGFLK